MNLQKKTTTKVGTRTLAKEIAKTTGQNLELINHILKVLPFHILRHFLEGKTVRLTSLGCFVPLKRKPRLGLNLKGKRQMWPKTIRMQFVPSRLVRKRLQEEANK